MARRRQYNLAETLAIIESIEHREAVWDRAGRGDNTLWNHCIEAEWAIGTGRCRLNVEMKLIKMSRNQILKLLRSLTSRTHMETAEAINMLA